MKYIAIVAFMCVALFGCNTKPSKSYTYTTYLPYTASVPNNCFLTNPEVIFINGVVSFEYICNGVR